MRIYLECDNLDENSRIIPYLMRLSRKEPCKFYYKKRKDLRFMKFNKLSKNLKNYTTLTFEDNTIKLGNSSLKVDEDYLDIGMFSKIPTLDREGTVQLIDNETIIHKGTSTVLASTASDFEEALVLAQQSIVVLLKAGTEAEGLMTPAFNVDDEKLPRWLDKFATMDQFEYDYILNLQRHLLCKQKDITESYEKFLHMIKVGDSNE